MTLPDPGVTTPPTDEQRELNRPQNAKLTKTGRDTSDDWHCKRCTAVMWRPRGAVTYTDSEWADAVARKDVEHARRCQGYRAEASK